LPDLKKIGLSAFFSMASPPLLLYDEPVAGLALPSAQYDILDNI